MAAMRIHSAVAVLALVAAGCAKTEPATRIAPAPETASTARAPAPPAIDAGTASIDSGAPPTATAPQDPRCAGAAIDLTAILLDRACVDGDRANDAEPASPTRVTVAAPPRLAPGAEGIATVTFTNVGAADLDLYVAVPRSLGFGLGMGFGPADDAKAPPRAVSGRQSTTSADGKRSFDARWSELTALAQSYAHVRVPPGGAADLRVTLRARGFLPGKAYEPSSFSIDSPPDPLPVGRYKITLAVIIGTRGITAPVVDLEVRR
jgi:hypothetical protein